MWHILFKTKWVISGSRDVVQTDFHIGMEDLSISGGVSEGELDSYLK